MTAANRFIQAGFIVNDLHQAMAHWTRTVGVGPFFLFPKAPVRDTRYRGVPRAFEFGAAVAQAGPIQIELIQQYDDGPSAYRDMFPQGCEGFHHFCAITDDYDTEVRRHQQQGNVVAADGYNGDMRFCYVDTRSSLGFMTELIERSETLLALFADVARAAEGWRGEDPVRVIES